MFASLAPDPLTVFRRRYIGFVFQSYNLIPGLNIWENITLPLGLDKLKADREETAHLLSTLGIYEKRYSMPSQLSGGQRTELPCPVRTAHFHHFYTLSSVDSSV